MKRLTILLMVVILSSVAYSQKKFKVTIPYDAELQLTYYPSNELQTFNRQHWHESPIIKYAYAKDEQFEYALTDTIYGTITCIVTPKNVINAGRRLASIGDTLVVKSVSGKQYDTVYEIMTLDNYRYSIPFGNKLASIKQSIEQFQRNKESYLAWSVWKLEQKILVEQKRLQDSIKVAKQDIILAEKQAEIKRSNSERANRLITEQIRDYVTIKYYLDDNGEYHGTYIAEFNQPKVQYGWQGTAKLTLTYVHGIISGDATYVSNRRYYDNNLVNVSTMKSIRIMRPTEKIYVQYSDNVPLTKFKIANNRLSGKVDLIVDNIRYVGTCNDDGYVIGKFEIYNALAKDDNKWLCTNGGTTETNADGYDKDDIKRLNEWNTWTERNPETYKSITTGRYENKNQVDYRDSDVGYQSAYITFFDNSSLYLPKYKTIYVPAIPKY
ncbi:hypothetical protein [Dysgonomonas sp. ZJ709]|uniref:hypothetical protein n=1 Tax=Dysgonomonas sp. ZJ709 TaxID=2709797 RepID=UPI0013EC9A3D|nr:hypothetical protein [Dysgonomonas sp. ZJ709]